MRNFRGADMPGKISYAKDSPPQSKGKGAEAPSQSQSQPEAADTSAGTDTGTSSESEGTGSTGSSDSGESGGDEEVPEGTTTEILRWVGDDKGRAQAALDKESESDPPRSGLTSELNKILSSA